jgi:hypothetical protein
MQTLYTVTKTTRDAEPTAAEVERREGLTWDEAAAFARELGAVTAVEASEPGAPAWFGTFRTADPVELVRIAAEQA